MHTGQLPNVLMFRVERRPRVHHDIAAYLDCQRAGAGWVPSKAQLLSWAFYDWASNAFVTIIQTFPFAAYFTRQVAQNETVGSSQWGYAIGLAGLVVAVSGPVLGAMVD